MPRQFIVFDTESTGLKRTTVDLSIPSGMRARGDEVCQIGGLILDERMEPQRLFCHYCDTIAVESDAKAFEVHGISMKEVRQHVRCQYLTNVLYDHVPEFFWNDIMFVGYNVEFDMEMVAQTLSNSDVEFKWTPLKGNIVPKTGRYSIDVAEFYRQNSTRNKGSTFYRRLSSFEKELEQPREEFFVRYGYLEMQTNCMEMLAPTWDKAHNAFFDALNTYLLWRDRIWRKKLI